MLYNKNNVRKTNDKKILHKVGKQWKVVSVALLMALGGGAAVAATNTANANADANNGVSQETQATVNSLEQGPQIGQSSAPASASSKASSASSAAPVMPQLSLNPDPSLNGNNASAEFARVKQGYDHAVVGYYGKLVNSYVNFVNSNYSASANSVNSKFASASNKQSNDSSSASSFAAVASGKDWMNEVNNIAKAKSGVTGSEFIDAVQNITSNNTKDVSASANTVSAASAVVSAAQLVSDVIANKGNNGYRAQAISASAAKDYYGRAYLAASTAYSNAVLASGNNQTASANAYYVSLENSIADSYALQNANADTSATASLANSRYNKNYASASSAVAVMAEAYNNRGIHTNPKAAMVSKRNKPSEHEELIEALNRMPEADHDKITTAYNALEEASNASLSSTNDAAKLSLASLANSVMSSASNAHVSVNLPSMPANKLVSYAATRFNVQLSPVETSLLNSKVAAHFGKGNVAISANGNNVSVNGVQEKLQNVQQMVNNAKNAAQVDQTNANNAINSAHNTINNMKNDNVTVNGKPMSVTDFANTLIKTTPKRKPNKPNKPVTPNFGDLTTLVSDTAAEQRYGSVKSSCDNIMNSANAASASANAAVTSASEAMTSNSAKYASAKSASNTATTLATAQGLNAVYAIVPSAANSFKKYDNVANLLTAKGNKVSDAVSNLASEANNAGSQYTSASSASESYAKSTDANFVLASYYASSYSAMSSSDAKEFNAASAARDDFYNTYAGHDFVGDNAQLTSAEADEPNQGALANGYARYVQIHEPHVVTVTKQLVMHANPNYNDKTDTPADAKLAVINKGTHLLVENVGFDKHGNTRLYVNYNGKKGFITGLRNYVADSYLVPGEKYSVTFGRTANQYKGLQFNKANATKFSVKAGQTVTGTAVLNDDPHYWNGLTRLQLSNGNFVTTLDSYIKSATPLNGQSTQQSKGAYFWNGQDNTFKNVTK